MKTEQKFYFSPDLKVIKSENTNKRFFVASGPLTSPKQASEYNIGSTSSW